MVHTWKNEDSRTEHWEQGRDSSDHRSGNYFGVRHSDRKPPRPGQLNLNNDSLVDRAWRKKLRHMNGPRCMRSGTILYNYNVPIRRYAAQGSARRLIGLDQLNGPRGSSQVHYEVSTPKATHLAIINLLVLRRLQVFEYPQKSLPISIFSAHLYDTHQMSIHHTLSLRLDASGDLCPSFKGRKAMRCKPEGVFEGLSDCCFSSRLPYILYLPYALHDFILISLRLN